MTGLDLVALQLAIAGGAAYDQLGLPAGISCEATTVAGDPAWIARHRDPDQGQR
ncbi:hypothetical protein PJN35_28205 [Mycobacterium kansasii]|uniref:Uncharacterized protein n=2 Tax=Mycobacterium persicum TaxID=1487726 RepID=A0AB38URM3_9MYCO|nr:hypothetical protein LAUMK42_02002 [Mycobacterium persicum]